MTMPLSLPDAQKTGKPAALRVGIIGTGPTALYSLQALLGSSRPCEIILYEIGDMVGPGIPFSKHHNDAEALANIASVELPPLCESLNQWAGRQSFERLQAWGIAAQANDDRAFFPRVVLGAYFTEQFDMMVSDPGHHRIVLRNRTEVTDVIARADGAVLHWRCGTQAGKDHVDRLVIATGYRTSGGMSTPGQVAHAAKARSTAILGSSLSAIDVVMTLACHHGRFMRDGKKLRYEGACDWHVTMLSRSGLLPEADFWFPYPCEPLDILTDRALAQAVAGRDGDLDCAFNLFARQLQALDPAYARAMGLEESDADSFAERYFAKRLASEPFDWAQRNLEMARQSHRHGQTEAWRYAILRMHQAFGRIVPLFSPRDRRRFERGLKRCFIDNYAAVPHLSIERLLALHKAGVLSVVGLGRKYRLTRTGQWNVSSPRGEPHFDAMIDARGQRPLRLDELPFPTLRLQLCAHAQAKAQNEAYGVQPDLGYAIDRQDPALSRVHCLALPFLLRHNPFIQGLTECAAIARTAVNAILSDMHPGEADIRRMIAQLAISIPLSCGNAGVITLPMPADKLPASLERTEQNPSCNVSSLGARHPGQSPNMRDLACLARE